MLTMRVLQNHCPCEVVHDGQQALDYLFAQGEFSARSPAELPMAILLDIGLPRLSGLEVLARIREDERTRLIPVVMFTSSDDQDDILTSYKNGANSYVRKPIEYENFSETLKRIESYWMDTNLPTFKTE
jgi:CheY-like chemotaxis protein